VYVNNKLADLLGENCIGSKCHKTLQGLEAPCEFCTNHIILGNKRRPYKWEYFNPSLDRHFSIVDRIIKWSNGRYVRFEMAMDITEHKRAEEALLESEEMQRKLLQAVPDLIIRTDMEGTITFVNELAFPGLEHLHAESICGRNIFSVIAEHDLKRAMKNARERLEKNIGPQEYQLHLGIGSLVDAEVNGAVIRDKEFRPQGMVYVIRDITERKRALQEREKLQGQLLQAQKMESLGILAGGVAHDFNNLLQAMSGNVELLMQSKPRDHPDTSRLLSIGRSVERGAQLVRQLMLFGRKAGSRRERLDLNREVQEALDILERTIPKMIALEQRLDPALWPIFADPVQIEQILLNLAANAVDAMPDGGKLFLETRNVVLDETFFKARKGAFAGPHVLLSVTDTGCGMDKTVLEHIFDPFFTTKEAGKGTGLGLASVYGIVQAHWGHIQCYSEPGSGTAFRIYLPAADPAEDSRDGTAHDTALRGGTECILVVDDDPEIRELTLEALESYGYAMESAASGEEALRIYQDHGRNIGLVLLDLNMPGMGGYKCLRELLELDPSVKVIIASGYPDTGHGRDPVFSGAKDFIGKPYQLRELAAKVRAVLDEEEGEKKK